MTRVGVVFAGLLLTSCVAVDEHAYNPHPPPPPLLAETIPKPPVTEQLLIWRPGHWDWNGSGYIWSPGQYVPREGHGSLWLEGHWQRSGASDVWVPAHWL
jgi:hypothetical protein